MGRKSLTQTKKAMRATTKVKRGKEVRIDTSEDKKESYKCWCCGKEYTKLANNFPPTNFPLFEEYGYYPVCRNCIGKFYDEMVSFFSGSEEKAVEFVCALCGIYFNENPLAASSNIGKHRTRFHAYMSRVNIRPKIYRGRRRNQ